MNGYTSSAWNYEIKQTSRIHKTNRITPHIRISIHAAFESNRITLEIPPSTRIAILAGETPTPNQ